MSAVKVVLRARPLSLKEEQKRARIILDFPDKTHALLARPYQSLLSSSTSHSGIQSPSASDPSLNDDPLQRTFTFDHCLWSTAQDRPHYASQQHVYDVVGKELVDHVLQGYNVCVLAYGQTGAGKTYTMMGNNTETGLVGLMCEAILGAEEESSWRREFEVSYMEIYNEKVRDLLNPNNRGNLRVREHPSLGPYVEDLSKSVVSSHSETLSLLLAGNKSRTVAATNMNDTSSRSHAVFVLTITQKHVDPTTQMTTEKLSRACFVDLAGSERADVSGTSGVRLKEGSQINKSLTSLCKVISLLAERSTKANNSSLHIPYRDSVLTWLLKDCLGGNSKTTLLALVSPTDSCHNETLSTLRFAERAKKVINTPVVNEDANGRFIRELQEEVERLRSQLDSYSSSKTVRGMVDLTMGGEEAIQGVQDELLASKKLLDEMMESYEDKLRKTETIQHDRDRALEELGIVLDVTSPNGVGGVYTPKTIPHLVNLNEDPFMSECLIYKISPLITRVGRAGTHPSPDIGLTGDNILPDHCHFATDDDGSVTVTPSDNERAVVLVNGRRIDGKKRLKSAYRIIIGDHIFRFNHPQELQRDRNHQQLIRTASPDPRRPSLDSSAGSRNASPEPPLSSSVVDWSFAVKEREQWDAQTASSIYSSGSDITMEPFKKPASVKPTQKDRIKKEEWDDQAQKIAELEQEISLARTHIADMEAGMNIGSDHSYGRSPSSNKSSPRQNVSVITVGGLQITVGGSAIARMEKEVARESERLKTLERKLESERSALYRKISGDSLRAAYNNANNINGSNVNALSEQELQLMTKAGTKWRGRRWVSFSKQLEGLKKILKEANVMSIELAAGVAYAPFCGHLSQKTSFWEVSDVTSPSYDDDNVDEETGGSSQVGIGVLVLDAKHESVYVWPLSYLNERLPYMRAMFNYYEGTLNSPITPITKPTDVDAVFGGRPGSKSRPWFTQIGTTYISARNLIRRTSKEVVSSVFSSEGDILGWLKLKIEPVGSVSTPTMGNPRLLPLQTSQYSDLDELVIGTDLIFEVSITQLSGISESDWTQVHAQLRLSTFSNGASVEKDKIYSTEPAIGFGRYPITWNFSQTISLKVDQNVKQIIERGTIEIEVFGRRRKEVSEVIAEVFGFRSEVDDILSNESLDSSPRLPDAERPSVVKSPEEIESELAEAQSTSIVATIRKRAAEMKIKQDQERITSRSGSSDGIGRGKIVYMGHGSNGHNRQELPNVWKTVEVIARSMPLPGNSTKNSGSSLNSSRTQVANLRRSSTSTFQSTTTTAEGKKTRLDAILQTRVLELSSDGEFRDVPIQCTLPQTTTPIFQLRQGLQRRIALRIRYSSDPKYITSMRITSISIGGAYIESAYTPRKSSASGPSARNSVVQMHSTPSSARSSVAGPNNRSSVVSLIQGHISNVNNGVNSLNGSGRTVYIRHDEIARQKASKDLSAGKAQVDVVFTWESGSPETDRETEDGKKVFATLSVEAVVDGGAVDSTLSFSTLISFVVLPRMPPAPILSPGRLSNFISSLVGGTPPTLITHATSLFELLVKQLPSRTSYWRALDTGNEYVRGEEVLNGWTPRGRELVAKYIQDHEKSLLQRDVEVWRGRWLEASEWVNSRGNIGAWSADDSGEIERRVVELWKGLVRSSSKKYYDTLLGIESGGSGSDDGDEVGATWAMEVKAIPQRNPVVTHRGYLHTPDDAKGTLSSSSSAPLVFNPNATWNRRYFVLQRPYLFMYVDDSLRDEINIITVRDVRVQWDTDIEELLHRSNTFSMYSNSRSYLFQAGNEQETADWNIEYAYLDASSASGKKNLRDLKFEAQAKHNLTQAKMEMDLEEEVREAYENVAPPLLKLGICKEGTVRTSLLALNRSLRGRLAPWGDSIAVHPAARLPIEHLDQTSRQRAHVKHAQDQQVTVVALKPFNETRKLFVERTFEIYATLQNPTILATNPTRSSNNSHSTMMMDVEDDDDASGLYGGVDDNDVAYASRVTAEHIVTVSSLYRTELKHHIKSLDRDTHESEVEVFQSMHSIWELCEIIYMNLDDMIPISTVLQSWLNTNYRGPSPKVASALNDLPGEALAANKSFWQYVHQCTLRGMHTIAVALLERLPYYKDSPKGPVNRVKQIVRQVTSKMSIIEVDERFEAIRESCLSALASNALVDKLGTRTQDVEGFKVLFKILSGDEKTIIEKSADWREGLVALAMYSRPSIKATELSELLFPLNYIIDKSEPLDAALVAFIHQDMMAARRHCAHIDFWLVTHLFDVLDRYGKSIRIGGSNNGNRTFGDLSSRGLLAESTLSTLWEEDKFAAASQRSNMREWTILNYAEQLLPHPELFVMGVEYLSYCPTIGLPYMIETILHHSPSSSPAQVERILKLAHKHKLDLVEKEVHRIMAQVELHRGHLVQALTHYALAGEPHRAAVLVNAAMSECHKTGILVDGLVTVKTDIPAIEFFNAYQQVREWYKTGDHYKAASKIILLMTSGIAPHSFWGMLLLDALPMLEGTQVVFGVADTYELMRCLQYICTSHKSAEYLGMYGQEGHAYGGKRGLSSANLDVIRAALARNLARAMVVELER
ncbi:hypothetical protein SmJEL517_g04804 [Synchytrium microbalum]|uniref:Nuclear pore complex protein Nup85 n=1 Tax=Synchytrium microbalum TaxID=1806994 RepID=A0A507BSE4_9FUNG|nr:uncharacterized protein SmJEL517_g04804 [Synchytrium microbalum]TPX31997.1 hypothetical protein SmJEL517_g04804 [Synchytrium microbalum]